MSTMKDYRILVEGQIGLGVLLFVIMLLAAFFEGVGISLVLPILSDVMEVNGTSTSGAWGNLMNSLRHRIGLDGLIVLLVIVFSIKSVLLVTLHSLRVFVAMRLRELWSRRQFDTLLIEDYAEQLDRRQGAVTNNLVQEPIHASRAVVQLLDLMSSAVLLFTLLLMMLATDWQVTLLALAIGGFLSALVWAVSKRYSESIGARRLKVSQQTQAVAAEGIRGLRELRIYDMGELIGNRFSKLLRKFTRISTHFSIFANIPSSITDLVAILVLGGVLFFFSQIRGEDIRETVAFLAFFMLMTQRLMTRLSDIISLRMKVSFFLPALRMVAANLQAGRSLVAEEVPDLQVGPLSEDICIEQLEFSHRDGTPVFKDLSLVIPFRGLTAFVGPSGAGKSTLADLLMQLLRPQSGIIRVNGRPLSDYNPGSWRSRVGYVSQEPFMLHGSIRENICLGCTSVTDDAMKYAAERAHVEDFINTLANDYETVVGDQAVKISGGQRQRIAIARAILRRPDLYIFDEPTSALDSESEAAVHATLRELARDKAVIVITHRIEALDKCDRIFELRRDGGVKDLRPDVMQTSVSGD